MRPLKVLLVHAHYSGALPSGESVVFEAERRLLEERGHEVVTYVRHADEVGEDRRAMIRAGLGAPWARGTRRALAALVARERPDVAHFHNTFPLVSPSAYAACRDAGVPVVQTAHNFRLVCANASLFRDGAPCEACVGHTPWRGILRACYRGSRAASAAAAAAAVTQRLAGERMVHTWIAPSVFARTMLVRGGLAAGRIVVKPHFVDPDPGPGDGDRPGALFVGRLSPEKGVPVLLRAFDELGARVPLTIVGDGPLAPAVEALAARDPAVRWERSLAPAAVQELMRRARVLVFPSVAYETFGRAVIEAFAAGTPVVASASGATTELVEDGRTGVLVPPGDAAVLAAAVRRLFDDQALVERMGREARATYLSRYTADANYRTLLAIYERALGRALPGAGDGLKGRSGHADGSGDHARPSRPRPSGVGGRL